MESFPPSAAESETYMRRTERNMYSSQVTYQTYGRQEPPYEEDEQSAYNEDPGYPYEEEQPYEEEPVYEEARQEPELVSTSQAINLTCTLAALSGFFAFFLYMADRRSEAVRRISVQSVALTGIFLSLSIVIWILGTLFGIIPILGIIFAIIFWLLFAVLLLAAVYLKVQMMLHAYRGLSYQLPVIGDYVRKFE